MCVHQLWPENPPGTYWTAFFSSISCKNVIVSQILLFTITYYQDDETITVEELKYVCPICNESFDELKVLELHIQNSHHEVFSLSKVCLAV